MLIPRMLIHRYRAIERMKRTKRCIDTKMYKESFYDTVVIKLEGILKCIGSPRDLNVISELNPPFLDSTTFCKSGLHI